MCKANDPEADTLSALFAVAESLNMIENSMGTDANKEIIILDTGVCTRGVLNFYIPEYRDLISYEGKIWENNAISCKVNDLIESLNQRAEIPNLNGIKISWYCLGQVSDPQPSLSRLGIQNLQYVWGTLLKKAGSSQDGMQIAGENAIFMPPTTSGGIEKWKYFIFLL